MFCKKIATYEILCYGKQRFKKLLTDNSYFARDKRSESNKNSISTICSQIINWFINQNSNLMTIKNITDMMGKYKEISKTTTCKLYQSTYILCAAGILTKCETPSEFIMNDEYFSFIKSRYESIFSINHLLNKKPKQL